MRMKHRIIGWIGLGELTPAQAADRAIAKASEVLLGLPGVLHFDKLTGRLTLHADRDAPIPPATFARGVRFDSDPDVLAHDLRTEAVAARLIGGRLPKEKKSKPKKPGPPKGSRHDLTPEEESARKDALDKLAAGYHPVAAICSEYGITRSTLYRWRRAANGGGK